jgi:DNA-binding response OmpR family regulator
MSNTTSNLLLIEDDPSYVRLLQRVLEDEFARRGEAFPYRFEWVERLSAGLAALEQGDIALLLTDLSLPDEKGFSVFARLAAAAPDVPIIVLTGIDDEELGARIVQEGAQDYLVKTHVNGYLLKRAIRHAIERKRAADERECLVRELQQALRRISVLQGILRICSHCKRIRDDGGAWHSVEVFVSNHSNAEFSHSICPQCLTEHYRGLGASHPPASTSPG